MGTAHPVGTRTYYMHALRGWVTYPKAGSGIWTEGTQARGEVATKGANDHNAGCTRKRPRYWRRLACS